jgi:prolyl-tRNA synthetase
MYSKWIKSYRDLPVLINQWGNVVRWEMRTRLFLRTLEFYRKEGHTAHATSEEAMEETLRMLGVYADMAIKEAAIPVVQGVKSDKERFAGAVQSYTIEAMMGVRPRLGPHYFGQNFCRLSTSVLDWNNQMQYAWTSRTSPHGRCIIMTTVTTRVSLPPNLAPSRSSLFPFIKMKMAPQVMGVVDRLRLELAAFRLKLTTTEVTPGSNSTTGNA